MKTPLIVLLSAALAAGGTYLVLRSDNSGAPSVGRAGPPGGAGDFGSRQQAPLVRTSLVREEPITDVVSAIGTVRANESVTLTAKVTDTISSVDFEDGDFVDKGAVLVQLTNREEEALLAEARANLDDAQSQLARLENLIQQDLISESEIDIARSRAEASSARMETVVARLSDRLIRAPFAGVLGFRDISPGTLLQPNTPITTLDDISTIKLDFTVPETFFGSMRENTTVLASSASYPDRVFEGTVNSVGSRVDAVTRAFQVRALIPNEDQALRPGMLLTVEVVISERTVLVVPENAVFQIQDRAYVYVVDSEMIAHEREFESGERRFGLVEVVDGLVAGETIVTEGIVKLRNGVQVRTESSPQSRSERAESAG